MQGYIDCDDLHGRGTCRGVVQVCGPLSGTYKLEVTAQKTTAYSVSEAGLNKVAIRAGSRNSVLLNYSRDPQEKVTAELQHVLNAQRR